MDTPFNQTSYTEQTIKDQQARTVADVLKNDPSVRSAYPSNSGFERFFIRGFPVTSQEIGFNGLYGLSTSESMSFLSAIERVEVLKGPATLVNGMPPAGSLGGSVNLISKHAGSEPLTEVTTSYISDGQFGTHLDTGARFGTEKEFGVRFNGSYLDGDTALDHQSAADGSAMLSLDYRGQFVRIAADIGYASQDIAPISRFITVSPALTSVPPAPEARTNFSQPWLPFKNRSWLATVQGEVDLAENVTAYGAFGIVRAESDVSNTSSTLLNSTGNTINVAILNPIERDNVVGQGGLRTRLETGPVTHRLNFNASIWSGETANAIAVPGLFASNIYRPNLVPPLTLNWPKPGKSE